jgi:acetyltransferase-like isoleucine patch superfamily enzyme
MRLSELPADTSVEVLRDGEFESLGLLFYDAPRLLVGLDDARFLGDVLRNERISCVITTASLSHRIPDRCGLAVDREPRSAFYGVHEWLSCCTEFYWRNFDTEISPLAAVDKQASVARHNVRIGKGSVIEPGVTIRERTLIGEDVVIRSGCVIGAEGFDPREHAEVVRITPHAGGVRIHDGVEIQSNSVVCRCVFQGFTEIGVSTKISSLVNVSHNVKIGRCCRIGAGALIMGSAGIGDEVWIGPNATISNRVLLKDEARVSLGAVVVRDVAAKETVSGNFAVEHSKFLRFWRKLRGGKQ